MISAKNITKSYAEVQALKGVSLEVEQGELFGLIGPDGAGKTTLIRILMSLLLPDSGKAHMSSYDVVKDYKQVRQITGYMPGRFSLYQDLTVEENLQFFATVFGTTIEKNYDLIKDIYFQIEPFKNRRAGQLSGGMKQKLALSCALIHKPEILILDEPTTGVDVMSRKEFWDMLDKLKTQGITILVSTPYMDEAVLCDRIALMQNGEIFSIDTPQNMMDRFPEDIWQMRSEASIYRTIKALQDLPHIISANSFGQYLHLVTQKEMITEDEISLFLQNKNLNDIEIERISATVEDVFIYNSTQ
jgi:ABC-type multidrug transport system ATPase subunit